VEERTASSASSPCLQIWASPAIAKIPEEAGPPACSCDLSSHHTLAAAEQPALPREQQLHRVLDLEVAPFDRECLGEMRGKRLDTEALGGVMSGCDQVDP
jgi:hypothetical protein